MATFVIGEDTVRMEKQRKEMENLEKCRRHYKKDSRYLEDLYTLTYQEDSSIEDDNEEQNPKQPGLGLGLASLQVPIIAVDFESVIISESSELDSTLLESAPSNLQKNLLQ